jgi:transcriptional regulator with XRE-family HTH domain
MIEADKQPGVLSLGLGSRLREVREAADLSYDEAAAQLGCEADWLARVETGFAVAAPEEVARMLVEYGARDNPAADKLIDLARRAAAPPPWLARHTSRLTAAYRDLILLEAEATLAQVHGCRLVPLLAQTEDYFRETTPDLFRKGTVEQEWDLLSSRQAHKPAGVTRLLDVIIDESAFILRTKQREIMAGQIRHLLALAEGPHVTVRIIPMDAPFWENRGHNFDILSFAGTDDRISVSYTFLGPMLISADAHEIWTHIENICAADPAQSQAILEHHLAAYE